MHIFIVTSTEIKFGTEKKSSEIGPFPTTRLVDHDLAVADKTKEDKSYRH